MAANTLRPTAGPVPRANVARPATPPPAPEEVPAATTAPAAPVAPPVADKPAAAPPRKLAPEPYDDGQPVSPGSAWSLFSLLDRFTGLDSFFEEGLPVKYLPKLLFVMLLTLLYIGNTHYGNRMNRNIQRLKLETEDLRADYTTLSSDYMEASKQSEVARKVAAIGLIESSSPPFRIGVPAGRLDGAELETMPVLTADTLAARAVHDSIAAQRADSLRGRIRQQASDAATAADAADEAGPPPPGPEEDTAGESVTRNAPVELAAGKPTRTAAKSPKKPKTVQNKETTRPARSRAASAPSNSKKPPHERKR